jgi:hypothetical protein
VIAAVLALVIVRPGGGDRRAEPRAGEGLSRSPDERVSVTSGIGELRADGVTPPKP